MAAPAVQPGDVLAIRTTGAPAWLIRFGEFIHGQPDLSNHIAVVDHTDPAGVLWCIEGRPGGVGYHTAGAYLESAALLTNANQPKTPEQRAAVTATMKALLGTPYDWEAIVADALTDLGMHLPGWDPSWHGDVPGHVLCSSLAAFGYAKNGLTCPLGDRGVQPSDWDAFILDRAWADGKDNL